jgi:hydrogenase nickel incorporation protein HypB
MSQARAIQIETDVLAANGLIAARNRLHFEEHRVLALNLVSSPGSGKTTLLCRTIAALRSAAPQLQLGVIEGDQQTSRDADRVREAGAAAVQVNTGKGCHLDAQMVADAFGRLPMHGGAAHEDGHAHDHAHDHDHGHDHSHDHGHDHMRAHGLRGRREGILFIENVGNLVCPALWDLGEKAKVAILSVTEGEDKPLKYPDMFAAAKLLVINKIDLLPYVQFDVAACIAFARRVNPHIEVLQVSATRGDGMEAFVHWLLRAQGAEAEPESSTESALRARIAELEARLRRAGLST